jgi:hypothetical protein
MRHEHLRPVPVFLQLALGHAAVGEKEEAQSAGNRYVYGAHYPVFPGGPGSLPIKSPKG